MFCKTRRATQIKFNSFHIGVQFIGVQFNSSIEFNGLKPSIAATPMPKRFEKMQSV